MKVIVASANPSKIRAVGRALDQRPDLQFRRAHVIGIASKSDVPEQPMTMEETARGAVNRVLNLLPGEPDVMHIGIESGLFMLGGDTQTTTFVPAQVMDFCVAYVLVGKRSAFGTSSGFALPTMLSHKFTGPAGAFARHPDGTYTLDDAAHEAGLSDQTRLGYDVGIVGLLSGGRLSREDYTLEAVRNALFGLVPVL